MTGQTNLSTPPDYQKAASVVRDAGGRVVGRTRLQKIAYLLELAGVGEGFPFQYRHYGPYSEPLTQAIKLANLFGLISEEERPTSWGGTYSIFEFTGERQQCMNEVRRKLTALAVDSDPIELELAATAAFLSLEGEVDPWSETRKRKPDKADQDRLDKAKQLYLQLRQASEDRLPAI
jgi:uncharacterized protein YwgA